jgi:adenylosuccinate lyase
MRYYSILGERYASRKMSRIFSEEKKFKTWRKLWVFLAECQSSLGLNITKEQISQLKQSADDLNIGCAKKYEKLVQHDVMAHIHAYGEQAPLAKPIIHLGATSCLITDNADMLIIREALELLRQKIIQVVKQLSVLSKKYQYVHCLGYTHFQVAQPTTLGKRITMWLQDFLMDLEDLQYRLVNLKTLGIKGATGTQASFLDLFDQNHEKVNSLERMMLEKMGFRSAYTITGQTYPRKQDQRLLDMLSGLAASAHKFATDFRLLSHLGVMEEPASEKQVGSSAMPYKRNPIFTERICGLSRFVISLSDNPKYTLCNQWLERSLDDSANRRIVIPDSFLATDAILDLLIKVTKEPVVHSKRIAYQLKEELPFLLTERILMLSVKKGYDRQLVHERIREHSIFVSNQLKEGIIKENELFKHLGNDEHIPFTVSELERIAEDINLVGRAPEQVDTFLKEVRLKLDKILDSKY